MLTAKYKVLVIDDEKVLSDTIVKLLSLYNFSPDVAYNGITGIDLINNENYDAIICDISLPDIAGYDILKYVRSDPRTFHIPFIFLTAYSDEQDIQQAMSMGADDYIVKPFSGNKLVAAIKDKIALNKSNGLDYQGKVSTEWMETINVNLSKTFYEPAQMMRDLCLTISNSDKADKSIQQLAKQAIPTINTLLVNNNRINLVLLLLTNHITPAINRVNNSSLDELLRQKINTYLSSGNDNIYLDIDNVNNWRGEEDHLLIIFSELINNAKKFRLKDTKIFIRLTASENSFSFSISNILLNPLAIDVKDILPFRKFDDNNEPKDLGIGLYICKELCRIYNYRLSIKQDEPYITFSVIS